MPVLQTPHGGRLGFVCCRCDLAVVRALVLWAGCLTSVTTRAAENGEAGWTPATRTETVTADGEWSESSARYARRSHLMTTGDGDTLRVTFDGTAIAVRLGAHPGPEYGAVNLGRLDVTVDGRRLSPIFPQIDAREVLLTRKLSPGRHVVQLTHRRRSSGSGCRIEGFRSWDGSRGTLEFAVHGEENRFLVDLRAVLSRDGKVIRDSLVRNWMTGQCRMTGLPSGGSLTLRLSAAGWQPLVIRDLALKPGQTLVLGPQFLKRDPATVIKRFRFPVLNRPAVIRPGDEFPVRFLGFETRIDRVVLTQRAGPAVISRDVAFQENTQAAFYYDRQIRVRLPSDMPIGIYDLEVHVDGGRRSGVCRSPRSVCVRAGWPQDATFVTFGHLDTSGQFQAEYLERLAGMINVIDPEMVLISNSVNAAYVSGALAKLRVPYLVNFGNHQVPGHEHWYGDPLSLIDYGPDLCILNCGRPWHESARRADALLRQRMGTSVKVINAFEHNAPLELLNRHKVCLIHDAHGPGKKVMDMGATPTRRVGKSSASSFRVVRLRAGRVVSCTYNGHETDPIPFPRDEQPPLQVEFSPANDGASKSVTARIQNQLAEPFPAARLRFVMPRGRYQVDRGRILATTDSDDRRLSVVDVRVDVPASNTSRVQIRAVP